MLPKKHRLHKSSDVKRTTLKGRSFFNPNFVIKVLPNNEKSRLTVIVSVKVSKKAVVRNRLKRLVRQLLQTKLSLIKTGDYAVILKPLAGKISPEELLYQLDQTLKKSRIIK